MCSEMKLSDALRNIIQEAENQGIQGWDFVYARECIEIITSDDIDDSDLQDVISRCDNLFNMCTSICNSLQFSDRSYIVVLQEIKKLKVKYELKLSQVKHSTQDKQ